MTEHVISHRGAGRKRALTPTAKRLIVLVVALAAMALATWLAPSMRSLSKTPPAPPTVQIWEETEAPRAATPPHADPPPQRPVAPRRARGPAPIPLDAAGGGHGEDFEILSAAELEAISQAGEDDAAPQVADAPQAATTAVNHTIGAGVSGGENQGRQSGRRTRRR